MREFPLSSLSLSVFGTHQHELVHEEDFVCQTQTNLENLSRLWMSGSKSGDSGEEECSIFSREDSSVCSGSLKLSMLGGTPQAVHVLMSIALPTIAQFSAGSQSQCLIIKAHKQHVQAFKS